MREIVYSPWSMVHSSWTRRLLLILLILSAFSFQLSASYAETVSSKELIENAKSLDGKVITYNGELVTAILNRERFSWINLNDGNSAIGVWCKTSQLNSVRFIGDYKNRGDMLEVNGKFNRSCPIHGGELDIHAESLKIINRGFAVEEKVDSKKLNVSIAIFLLILLISVVFRKRF